MTVLSGLPRKFKPLPEAIDVGVDGGTLTNKFLKCGLVQKDQLVYSHVPILQPNESALVSTTFKKPN